MSEPSWPPRVRESHEPDRPRTPEAADEPPGPESIGAVDHGRTKLRKPRRDPSVDEADEDLEDGGADGIRRGPRSRLATGLLVGGLVLMTALATTFLALWLGSSETEPDEVRAYMDEQRPEIAEKARTAVDILINYDSANIDERRAEMLAITTGGFRDDYEQFTDTLGSALEEAGASSRGSILDEPRISFTSPEEADVIVRTEQIAQTTDNPQGRTIEYIMRLGLIDTQGGWKVDNIEILSDELT